MAQLISDIEQVTPTWLTNLLRSRGCLEEGHISRVEYARSESYRALLYALTLTYSPNASPSAPARIFLKFTKPSMLPENEREVRFYNTIAPTMSQAPVVGCYDAVYDSDTGAYHVLLEDLGATHYVTPFPLPPSKQHTELMIDALVKIHAFWWDHPRLDQEFQPSPIPELVQRYTEKMTEEYSDLVDFLGDRLSGERKSYFNSTFTSYPSLMVERLNRGKHLTFVHADAHAWNFLVPKDPRGRAAYLIDWHTFDWYLQCSTGVSDLAYMMVHNWFPDHRRRNEQFVLRRYHEKLAEYGVRGYSWDDLWYDYRLAALSSLYVVALWGGFAPTAQTMYIQLENAMSAFRELDCVELLER